MADIKVSAKRRSNFAVLHDKSDVTIKVKDSQQEDRQLNNE
jgi:hypothetical protein